MIKQSREGLCDSRRNVALAFFIRGCNQSNLSTNVFIKRAAKVEFFFYRIQKKWFSDGLTVNSSLIRLLKP